MLGRRPPDLLAPRWMVCWRGREATISQSLETFPGCSSRQEGSVADGKAVHFPIRNIVLPAGRNSALFRFLQEAHGYGARWRAAVILLALIVLALALSLPRLTTPAVYVFDE